MITALSDAACYAWGGDDERWEWGSGVSRERAPFMKIVPLRNERLHRVQILGGKELPDPETAARLKERGDGFDTTGPS